MNIKLLVMSCIVSFIFTGCGVGTLVALPFKVTGAVVNVVTPDVVGDSISTAGDAVDTAIPF
jgi:hypothetical protein